MYQFSNRALFCSFIICTPMAAHAQDRELTPLQIIGSSPVAGDAIDRDKLPNGTQSLTADDFDRDKDELARKYASVYTFPQTTENNMLIVGLNGKVSINDHWALQSNLYVRHFDQRHVDGNSSDITVCEVDPTLLCLGTATGQNAATGTSLSSDLLPGDGLNQGIAGSIDRTHVNSNTVGGSLQTTYDGSPLGLDNHFVAGGSVDYSSLSFDGKNELGTIPDATIDPDVVDTGITRVNLTF